MNPRLVSGALRVKLAGSYFPKLFGLMGRGIWPSRWQGILFPKCRAVHTFFTFLKPDLVFLDAEDRVLKIFPLAKPWRFFIGPRETRSCLEVPSGWAGKAKWSKRKKIHWRPI